MKKQKKKLKLKLPKELRAKKTKRPKIRLNYKQSKLLGRVVKDGLLKLTPDKKVKIIHIDRADPPKERLLPIVDNPTNRDDAAKRLGVLTKLVGEVLDKFAFVTGYYLAWVKYDLKRENGHGHFGEWLKKNVTFSERSAQRYMRFYQVCSEAGEILKYSFTGKSDTVSEIDRVTTIDGPVDPENENTEAMDADYERIETQPKPKDFKPWRIARLVVKSLVKRFPSQDDRTKVCLELKDLIDQELHWLESRKHLVAGEPKVPVEMLKNTEPDEFAKLMDGEGE